MNRQNHLGRRAALRKVPPAPAVMAGLYEQYARTAKPYGIRFHQYLGMTGYSNPADRVTGMDDGLTEALPLPMPHLIGVPETQVKGALRVKVLLIDFPDQPAQESPTRYQELLFSKGNHPTGSMRDYYREVTMGQVDVQGSVHGWLRMPQNYTYYTNGESGLGYYSYPRNAQRMAEDAVGAALAAGVPFEPDLDKFGSGQITALFIVHAGPGAEVLGASQRDDHIWSHKWSVRNPVNVGGGLTAAVYLTVPEDCLLGVCAHELGHLAFQWEDFYDPNYGEDGFEWDGSGNWDLMASGSYNGDSRSPAHPAGLHKHQHRWVDVEEIDRSTVLTLEPYSPTSGKVVKIRGPHYAPQQYILLENRTRMGFDAALPGQGLLVWRVDEREQMTSPAKPALLLIQADGRHDLERVGDYNAGDEGDPFPGSSGRTLLGDTGEISTTFPGGDRSEVTLSNIRQDPATNAITVEVTIGSDDPVVDELDPIYQVVDANLAIPDRNPAGVTSQIAVTEDGIVRAVQVAVNITHTYVGDLRVELIAPSGERAVLHDRAGGSSGDLVATYDSARHPALAALAGNPVRGNWLLQVTDHAAYDQGTLNQWALQLFRTAVVDDNRIRVESRPALAIPDNNPAGVGDTMAVSRAGIVRDLRVELEVTHSFIGDLLIELIAPDGTRAVLHRRTGSGTHNIRETYTLASHPELGTLVGTSTQGDWVLWASDHMARDVGTIDRWALDIGLGAGARVARGHAEPDVAIPDDQPAGVASAIAIDEEGTAQSIRVDVEIIHPYVGDLRVELIAPGGERVLLHNRTGRSADNLIRAYDSVGHEGLRGLVGLPIQGQWTLRVTDRAFRDVGRLVGWRIELPYTA